MCFKQVLCHAKYSSASRLNVGSSRAGSLSTEHSELSTFSSPKPPLPRAEHIPPQQRIGHRMCQHAGAQAARAVGDEIEERPSESRSRPVGEPMLESEACRDHREGRP